MGKFYYWLVRKMSDEFLLEAVHQAAARYQVRKDPLSRRDSKAEIVHQMRTTSVWDLVCDFESRIILQREDKETAQATNTTCWTKEEGTK